MTECVTMAIAKSVEEVLAGAVLSVYEDGRGVVIRVVPSAVLSALGLLKNHASSPFDLLADEIGVDFLTWHEETGLPNPPGRFGIYYNLYSLQTKQRIFVETFVAADETLPSAVSLYASANWAERIIFDLFGVRFDEHPDLRRIYMTSDYEYYPMRKDFPRRGVDPQDFPQE